MEQIVVKTEMQPNGEILLFYVDENDTVTTDNIESQLLQMGEGGDFETQVLEEAPESNNWNVTEEVEQNNEKWTDDEVKRLLVFFIDNKHVFCSGTAQKKHLWSVACKTMLLGKSAQNCEVKVKNLKRKYTTMLLNHQKGADITWPLFEMCHQAFHDDTYVQYMLREQSEQEEEQKVIIPIAKSDDANGVIVVKNVNTKSPGDANVMLMLNLYLRYKKNFQKDYWRKGLWETIAVELGEEDADYWHKRFSNFKQHYVRMMAKRETEGPNSVNWPYMEAFDRIFEDDPVFQKKYASSKTHDSSKIEIPRLHVQVQHKEWNDTEMMILVKYYFDCFDEFQDSTIPDNFLWTEVGRLLDKKPNSCKQKFDELKRAHLEKYVQGRYTLRERKPLAIIFDNIISREIEIELDLEKQRRMEIWQTSEMDDLVQFLYENIEMVKDPVCYYVCWAAIAIKLNKSVQACKKQWEELKKLYKSILDEKKEDPEMQIDWRYIELFDRILDYGMDTNLLTDFKQLKEQSMKAHSDKIGVKKVNIKTEAEPADLISDDEEFDERGFTKRTKRGVGESKAFKILEFYQKHKEKFSLSQRKKQTLWEVLAQQIGISGEQCAHRFRNLKQVYTMYVQREINKPEMPILWPYYALCKKVFGYRAIKSKLKNNKADFEENEEWAAKEIKLIINFFASNFAEISNDADNKTSKWSALAKSMGKSETSVNDKFLELRRSYLKLKTMKENNPECKVSWKYYNLFDEVYAKAGVYNSEMEVEELDMNTIYEEEVSEENVKSSQHDDEDYQCIIVIPEGQDISDISHAQIIIQNDDQDIQMEEQTEDIHEVISETTTKQSTVKWSRKLKKRLLLLYLKYIKSKRGKEISAPEMWSEIASQLPGKKPANCRVMFGVLKRNHIIKSSEDNDNKSPYYNLLQKITKMKPKFIKKNLNNTDGKDYKDVLLPTAKVELALQYYLQHIDEFNSPKYEKKYLWTELSSFVSEPVLKLFNKINYLKKYYNVETDEVNGEKTLFGELLKNIVSKELVIQAAVQTGPQLSEKIDEKLWTDEEIDQLLNWYLANLDKFKNPKFVRKYLWMEATSILGKSPLACSKKMTEIRTQYKTMIKENPEELNAWRFYELCQKIYGTGKKSESSGGQ